MYTYATNQFGILVFSTTLMKTESHGFFWLANVSFIYLTYLFVKIENKNENSFFFRSSETAFDLWRDKNLKVHICKWEKQVISLHHVSIEQGERLRQIALVFKNEIDLLLVIIRWKSSKWFITNWVVLEKHVYEHHNFFAWKFQYIMLCCVVWICDRKL
jgi:hypothetical protein